MREDDNRLEKISLWESSATRNWRPFPFVEAIGKYQIENWETAAFQNKCQGNECQLYTDISQDIKIW